MKKLYALAIGILVLGATLNVEGQVYKDYIGAGHNGGITVTSCSDQSIPNWAQTASAENTLNGAGLNAKYFESARFLAQSSFGKTPALIEHVANIGIENWIDEQMAISPSSTVDLMNTKLDEIIAHNLALGIPVEDIQYDPTAYHFNMAWFDNAVNRPDQLRQRIALSLSEILVVSNNSDLEQHGNATADYYDIFLEEAFGNYEDILRRVTLHPAMGFYLSHYNNPKTDPVLGTHPDENYARECMQLFSIGLYELNLDGTRKLDGNGDFIPTYDQNDIKEFAKVFTGLSAGAVIPGIDWAPEPYFGLYYGVADFTVPMAMYDEYHEPGQKFLLNDFELSGADGGMVEVTKTINHLFNHENVGPFIATRLIQSLVKSNPSLDYIKRVSLAFNNNGQGIRGDMKAVIKAILLDDEARNCEWITDAENGKLKEPIVKFTEYFQAFDFINPDGYSWNPGFNYLEATDQYPMYSPSVFNFFTPNYQPNGPISQAGLVAPEFQILQTRTSIGYINWANLWSQGGYPYWHWEQDIDVLMLDNLEIRKMARDPEVLINYLDMVFVHGTMSQATRDIISDTMYSFFVPDDAPDDYYTLEYRAELGLYLTLISPDYNILR